MQPEHQWSIETSLVQTHEVGDSSDKSPKKHTAVLKKGASLLQSNSYSHQNDPNLVSL